MSTNSDQTPPSMLPQREAEFKQLLKVAGSKACKIGDLQAFVKHVFRGVPVSSIPQVAAVYCKHLETDPPNSGRFQALSGKRSMAYFSLTGIGNMADMTIEYPTEYQEGQKVIRQNWSNIMKWVRYAWKEVQAPGPAPLRIQLFATLNRDKGFFEWSVHNEDGFLELIVKTWWEYDTYPKKVSYAALRAFELVNCGLSCVIRRTHDGTSCISDLESEEEKKLDIEEATMRAVDGDASGLARHVMARLSIPNLRAAGDYKAAYVALSIIDALTTDLSGSERVTKFINAFCRNKLGHHAMQHLEFVLDDFEAQTPFLSEENRSFVVICCVKYMVYTMATTGALHWATLLLQKGFLRSIAKLVGIPHLVCDSIRDLLRPTLKDEIPTYLVHRQVVGAAIDAMKMATMDGSATSIESSFLGEDWKAFTQLVLERAIFNAMYKRHYDADVLEIKRCSYCGVIPETGGAGLRKCAGCMIPLYCSRHCQRSAWKSGHRLECEQSKGTTRLDTSKYGTNDFLRKLATTDVRRHAVGIKTAIKENASLKNANLQDVVVGISYLNQPPTITLKDIEIFRGESHKRNPALRERTYASLGSDQMLIHIISCKGGADEEEELHIEPTSLLDGVLDPRDGMSLPGHDDALASTCTRKPAQSEDGKDYEFQLDEIDARLLDAHRNYFSATDDGVDLKPRTVFDYVEERINWTPFD